MLKNIFSLPFSVSDSTASVSVCVLLQTETQYDATPNFAPRVQTTQSIVRLGSNVCKTADIVAVTSNQTVALETIELTTVRSQARCRVSA